MNRKEGKRQKQDALVTNQLSERMFAFIILNKLVKKYITPKYPHQYK